MSVDPPQSPRRVGEKADRLVFQPDASLALLRGINLIADAIRPTLGPIPRSIAFDLADAEKPPELLDKGGLIARRITDLPDRDEDMGAMLFRGMLWQLYDELGDGTATAALLFQTIVSDGLRVIVAGADAMRLRGELNRQLELALNALRQQMTAIEGRDKLAQLAHSICQDRELAERLGEIFDFIGEYGQLDVRRGHRREIAHDYMRGMYWNRGAVSRAMLRGGKEPDRMVMNDSAIMLSDLDIESLDEVATLFAALMQAGAKNLLLVGGKFSEPVINFILANKKPEQFRVVAVKTPGETPQHQHAHLMDMAVISGATPLYKAAGDTLRGMKTARLGSAKQVWVERNLFGLVSDRDNQQELTEHLADLLEQLDYARGKDSESVLRARVGKILGGVAILRIGDGLPARMDARIALAKETAKSLRQALRDGVVPGGGAALWAIRDALRDQPTGDFESRAARRILLRALEMPLRTICSNAGYDGATVARLDGEAPGTGIDARSGEAVDMLSAGIVDVASVVEASLHKAVSSAALALTIDVLLHHATPPSSYSP
ncbi:MAG: hypothetical protein OXE46_15025 [Chloroflexi bacterium]|nr:hypothetical protein [Chloroflexota bacterium]